MVFVKPVTRRAYTLLGTLLAITGLIIGYFSFYLPNREQKLIEQKSRVLSQIARNYEAKWQVFQQNADKKLMDDRDTSWLNIVISPKAITRQTLKTTSENNFKAALNNINRPETGNRSIVVRQNSDTLHFRNDPTEKIMQQLKTQEENDGKSLNLDEAMELAITDEKAIREISLMPDIFFDNNNSDYLSPAEINQLYENSKDYKALHLLIETKGNYPQKTEITVSWLGPKTKDTLNLHRQVNKVLARHLSDYKNFYLAQKQKDFLNKGHNSILEISFKKPGTAYFIFKEPDPTDVLYISTPAEQFILPLLETEDFDSYFLYREDPARAQQISKVVYQSQRGDLYVDQVNMPAQQDKDKNSKKINTHLYQPDLNQGTIQNAQLNGKAYKLLGTTFTTMEENEGSIKWHLVGLIDKEHFEKERRSVPPILIVTYTLALLLLLYGLPQLKLLFMSRIEQLSTTNFMLTCLSAVLCTSLIIIILLGLNAYSVNEIQRVDKSLKDIAQQLDEALKAETDALYRAARKYDTINAIQLYPTESNINSISLIDQKNASLLQQGGITPTDFDILFWINDKGEIVKEYSTIQSVDHHNALNLTNRAYYRCHQQQTAWNTPDKNGYFIESIQSWDKGDKSCVLSIKSEKDGAVLGIQKQLHSLYNTILPVGFDFQVIDQTGLVLFHSNSSKNLQENFLSESYNHDGIMASMLSHTALFTDNEYKHHNRRTYVKPLQGMPWYLIVSYDRRYSSIPVSLVVANTLISSALIAIILSVLFIITTRISRRPSRLAKSKIDISWLRPKTTNKELYFTTTLLNIVTIILLVFYNLFEEVISYQSFSIFLVTIILLYTTIYYKFRKRNKVDTPVFLSLLLAAFILFLQWFIYKLTLHDLIYLLVFLSLLAIYIFRKKPVNIFKGNMLTKRLEGNSFREAYTNMLFTFLMICAMLPVIFLFSKLYQEEQLLWKKYALFELNKKVLERDNTIRQKYQLFAGKSETESLSKELIQAWLEKGSYYKAAGYETGNCTKLSCHNSAPERQPFSLSYASLFQTDSSELYLFSILRKGRPNIAGLVTETNGFMLSQGYNKKWSQVYREIVTDKKQTPVTKSMMHIHINNQPLSSDTLSIGSTVPALFTGFTNIPDLLLPLVLLAFLYLVYLAVAYILRSYFSWNIFTLSKALSLSDDEYVQDHSGNHHQKTFFITSPYTTKIPLTGYESLNLTLIDSPDGFPIPQIQHIPDKKKILLENFSYNPQSIKTWNKKLALLEKLVYADAQIAIQSHFRPLQIFEVYEKDIRNAEHDPGRNEQKNVSATPFTASELNEILGRWKDVLATFFKVYVTPGYKITKKPNPLTVENEVTNLLDNEKAAWPKYFHWIDEFKKLFAPLSAVRGFAYWKSNHKKILADAGRNLAWQNKPQLRTHPEWVKHKTSTDPEIIHDIKEELILKIQSMAQPFYFSLWNNCSMEEKYILYDLAKDGFINPRSKNQVYLLMEKGLVYQDENDQLHIRNKSFRNFILTNIKKSEAMEIEKQVVQTGTYSILKAAVFIIAIASLGFIAFSNQGHLENLIALFTGLAAIIPMIFRFGGWFSTAEGLRQ